MPTQLDRLRQDVIELDEYIKKLEKRGKNELISKIKRKRHYLEKHITEKQLAI
jgi:flagellar motility protein MotE (MotC chaperone)